MCPRSSLNSIMYFGFGVRNTSFLLSDVTASRPWNASRCTKGERWLQDYPEASEKMMDLLTTVIVDYMAAQVQTSWRRILHSYLRYANETVSMHVPLLTHKVLAMTCVEYPVEAI